MSQILSIVLVIVMAFSSMTGLTAKIEDTVSFEAKVSVDAEAILALGGMAGTDALKADQETMKAVGDILNALTLKGVATKDSAELDLLAGADPALSIGIKNDEKGATVACNLLGSSVIFVSAVIIEQMQQQMISSMASQSSGLDMSALEALQNMDMEQAAKDLEETAQKLIQAIEAKKGETETGEFTVDDMTFVSKTPVNMTYVEFIELFLNSAKELAAKDSLKPLFQATGKDFGAEIDKAIEELKKQPETDYPTFELVTYTDADNCAYYACNMTEAAKAEGAQDEKLYIGYGEVGGQIRCNLDIDQGATKGNVVSVGTKEGAFDLTATIADKGTNAEITAKKDEAGNLDMVCLFTGMEPSMKIAVQTEKTADERTNFQIGLFMGDAEKPVLSFSGSAGKGGETISVYEGEKLTAIPIENLMNDPEQTETSKLQMQLIAGLLKTVTVVAKNVPEETGNWISTKIKEAMTPKTKTTETPTEQPVVDGE